MDFELLKKLRQRTQASLSLCKKALVETNNDIEKSVDWLRKKNIIRSSKSADREAGVRGVFIYEFNSHHTVYVVMCTESDFVLRNNKFENAIKGLLSESKDIKTAQDFETKASEQLKELSGLLGERIVVKDFYNIKIPNDNYGIYVHKLDGMIKNIGLVFAEGLEGKEGVKSALNDIAVHISGLAPKYLNTNDVEEEFLNKEKEIFLHAHEDKPANVQEKIWQGKKQKIFAEHVLLKQKMLDNENITVEGRLEQLKEDGKSIVIKNYMLIK